MKLYNTLARKVVNFESLKDKLVRVYSCGPTVYDHIHIGNLSYFIYADTLRRVLQANGYEVDHVMNITDVDDKTIRRSQEEHPDEDPMIALKSLTRDYEKVFVDDMQAVGNDIKALKLVRATESIKLMQALISQLYKQGFAYIADDGIYFSIEKYKKNGKKYGQLLELQTNNTSAARINNDEYDKESVHDFALWKLQKESEPAWEFNLDNHNLLGRPGWHIECSAMSVDKLGQPFDIHTGGVDLIFPHHENEIAQSTAGHKNASYANFFVHNEHLLVDGRKMSKSLNNFYTLADIKERDFDPLAFRLLVLQSHYRSQANFSWENLAAAQNRLHDLRAWADLRHQPTANAIPTNLDELLRDTRQLIQEALTNDLNTPAALASLGKLVNHMQQIPILSVDGKHTAEFLEFLDNIFGLQLNGRPDITKEQKQLLQARQLAREASDWAKSDQIRDQLGQQGLGMRDTDFGQRWYRF